MSVSKVQIEDFGQLYFNIETRTITRWMDKSDIKRDILPVFLDTVKDYLQWCCIIISYKNNMDVCNRYKCIYDKEIYNLYKLGDDNKFRYIISFPTFEDILDYIYLADK